ncbi:MAG: hypothetical protein AAFV77_07585 [Planctomycetota bacterium]
MLRFGPRSGGGWQVTSQGGELRWPVWTGNIFSHTPMPGTGHTVVAWSGWFDEDAQPESGVFHHDPRTWAGEGWERLEMRLDEVLPQFEAADARLLMRPHVRHVVSDAPSIRKVLERFDSPALGIFFEPAAMLTAAMVDDASDHLTRLIEAVLQGPIGPDRVEAFFLTGAERPARGEVYPEHDDLLVPAPMTRGAIGYHDLLGVLRATGPYPWPIVLYDEDADAQLDMLRQAGVLPSEPAQA